jgi:peptidase YpeB-like protein
MKTTLVIFSVIVVAVVAGAFSSVFPSQHVLAQMMNPKMMNPNMMGRMMGFNGSWMNPNMMFNGSWMNPMFQVQNITGSINLKSTILNSIASQIKVSLSDAAATAEKQVGNNSHAVAGHLGVSNGYLVYTISISDPDANIHWVVIDAGNGKVLSSLKLPWQNMMMFGGMMGMMGPNMMGNMMMNPSMMGNMMMNPSMMGMMGPNMMGNMMGFR